MRITKKKVGIIILIVLVVIVMVFAFQQNIAVRFYSETSDKLTAPVRIALITDLHSTVYGEKQRDLIKMIRTQKPDMICLAGDIADDRVPHDGTKQLLSVIAEEYPCYYVAGNHEFWSGEADLIKEMIRAYGVRVLEGESEIVTLNGQALQLYGVDDPDAFVRQGRIQAWSAQLDAFAPADAMYSVVLSHRPELTGFYQDSGADLVLAGHAHGGQIRLPGIVNGIYAPNQGFFPSYAGGRYVLGDTVLLVSRGLCKNSLPRIFNPPELVIIDLLPEKPVE